MRKKTCGKQKKNRCRRAPVGTPRKKRIMQDAKQPFPHFLGREGADETRPSAGRTSPQRTGGDRPSSARKAPPGSRRSPCTRQGSSGAPPYRGRRGGTEYDAVCVDSGLRGSLQERAAFRAETARGTQEAIVCGGHPWERGSEPLFFSPPSLDSLLFLESPRIGQVQQRVDNS